MSQKARYGDGDDCHIIPLQAIVGTTAIVSKVVGMYDKDSIGMQLITTGTVAGTWAVEVSNDFVPTTNGSVYGAVTASGDWTDITSEFSPSIADATTGGTNQYAQADLTARVIRVTFTPASGAGNVHVTAFAKSWS